MRSNNPIGMAIAHQAARRPYSYKNRRELEQDEISARIEQDKKAFEQVTDWEDTSISRLKRYMEREKERRERYLCEHCRSHRNDQK